MTALRLSLVAAALVLAACSGGGPSSTGGEETGPSTPATEEREPTLTATPPSATTRVTGVVERSPENRCLVLTTSDTPAAWVLTGAVAGLEPGDRVTVRGTPDPDATTRCQNGPVLVVAEVER